MYIPDTNVNVTTPAGTSSACAAAPPPRAWAAGTALAALTAKRPAERHITPSFCTAHRIKTPSHAPCGAKNYRFCTS